MVLAGEWPLSVQDICNTIHENYDPKITYQGVRKAVLQLETQGILHKNGLTFRISPEWVKRFNDYGAELVSKNCADKALDMANLPNNFSATITIKGKFSDVFYYLLAICGKLVQESNTSEPMISYSHNAWTVSIVSATQQEQLKTMASKKKHFILCDGKTPFDIFLLEFWKKNLNSEYCYDQKKASKSDIVLVDDIIFHIYFDESFKKKWTQSYRNAKKVTAADFASLYKFVFGEQVTVRIVITKNSGIAQKIRQNTMLAFSNGKIVKNQNRQKIPITAISKPAQRR
jgi:hypothetical protein